MRVRFRQARPRTERDRRSRTERFDASAFSAAAARAVVVDADVPAFGSAARAPMINVAVANNSSAHARAQRGVEHVAKANACAPDRFPHCPRVRVIIGLRANATSAFPFLAQKE